MKLVNNLDLNQNQIKNASLEVLASDPSSGNFEGRLFYNSTEKVIKWRTDAGVRKALHTVTVSTTPSLTATESNGTITLSIGNADGTNAGFLSAALYTLLNGATANNTASTIVRRDASGNFTAGTITATTVTGLSDPTSDTDAANKRYVDGAVAGLAWKEPVHAATTANITLSGTQTIDGHALVAGDRVLVKNQTTASENGIYVVASGSWTRATDADTSAEIWGAATLIQEGGQANTQWILTTPLPITVGSTALTFVQFGGGQSYSAGTGMVLNGTTFDVQGTTDRITVTADNVDIASTYVGQSSITTLGTITTGTWSGTAIAANKGGTGQTAYTIGDILYANSSSTLAVLAGVATGNALISGGTGTAPSWGKIGLTTHVSGTLAVGNGGTGVTTFTNNGVVLGGATLSTTSAGTADQVLRIPAAGGAPAFGAVDVSKAAAVTGTLAIGNGGTGGATAAAARSSLAVPTHYTAAVPSGSTSAAITHNLNTLNVVVEVYEQSTGATVFADVVRTNSNTVTLTFATAPSTNQYTVVIVGIA